ncbi:MAG: hypothetical protein Q8K24_08890 [Hydrogenophaga sp.]|nr:hypothetical protein [Hydrogenophaga sp.]
MTYVLQDNIPAPEARRAGRRPSGIKYPFADMSVGHSFFEPCEATAEKPLADVQTAAIDRLRSACGRWKKATGAAGVQFRVDVYTDGSGNHFVGCWRIA